MFVCKSCGKEIGSEKEYYEHINNCSNKDIYCEKCEKYISGATIELHNKLHEKDRACEICGKTIFFGISKFCSIACGNKSRAKRAEEYKKQGRLGNCLQCNKELDNKKRFYCDVKCQKLFEYELLKKELLKKGDFGNTNSYTVKKIIKEEDGIKCSICGITLWRNEEAPLILDHIDGNALNNKKENLRLVCCNCDAQLPTSKGRNRGNGRLTRKIKYRNNSEY